MQLSPFYSLLFVLATATSISAQQLPVVKAIGGDGRNVDWPKLKAEEDKEGPGYFYSDCAQGVRSVKASSTLAAQGNKSYGIGNISDDDPMTAWVEGVAGYGIGEWFEIDGFANTIYNGYQSTPASWLNNSRVKRFKVHFNGKPHCFLDLTDEMGAQRFDLDLGEEWVADKTYILRFEIVEVYKGAKWDDVAISHVDQVLCCFATNTQLMVTAGSAIEAGSIQKGTEIMAYDMETDSVFSTTVEMKATQKHVTLLRIKAGGREIEVTPDHPMYVKGRGFVSMQTLRNETPGKSYTEIAGMFELMMWDSEKSISYFSTIESVEVLKGDFQTVTVRQLVHGGMYIANGFVSKTY